MALSFHVSTTPRAEQHTGAEVGDRFGPAPVLQTQFDGFSDRQSTSMRMS